MSVLAFSAGGLAVTAVACTPSIVRVRIGHHEARTGAVQLAGPSEDALPGAVRVATGPLRLELSRYLTLGLDRLHDGGRLRLRFEVQGEQHFYGLGQGDAGFDRLGTARRLWNSHVNRGPGGDIAIPLLLSQRGHGLFFDTAAKAWVDAGDSYDQTWVDFTCEAGGVDVYSIAAPSLRAAMSDVAALLGRAPMPPRWVMGYMQSTRHFDSAEELAALVPTFRDKRLPLDAVALLSSYGEQRGWNRGVGRLDWQPDLAPEPAVLLDALHAAQVKLVLHEYPVLGRDAPLYDDAVAQNALLDAAYPEPAGAQPSANWHQGQRYLNFGLEAAGLWWWDRHADLLRLGVDAWWLDGGEGPFPPEDDAEGLAALHNRYDLLRQRAFAEGEARDRPDQRAFLLCRSGGPGMQAYGAACWSGDVNGSFESLAAQPAIALNVGMSGVPWWGSDIGGYYTVLHDTAELFVRWFQFGAFCPVFRAHGRDWRQHLPWAHGPEVEAICREVLEWRYRLAPYSYTLAWQAHRLGLPMMRPLVLNYPDDPMVWDMGHQFLYGDNLMAAPVTRPGATHWAVYMPAGAWYDFWTHAAYEGGRAVTVAAPLHRIPLFVPAGAILPLGPVRQHLSDAEPGALTLRIYPGPDAEFTLYEDDGTTRRYLCGDFTLMRIRCEAAKAGLVCRIGHAGQKRTARAITLEVRRPTAPSAVEWLEPAGPSLAWRHDGAHFLHVSLAAWPAAILIRD